MRTCLTACLLSKQVVVFWGFKVANFGQKVLNPHVLMNSPVFTVIKEGGLNHTLCDLIAFKNNKWIDRLRKK